MPCFEFGCADDDVIAAVLSSALPLIALTANEVDGSGAGPTRRTGTVALCVQTQTIIVSSFLVSFITLPPLYVSLSLEITELELVNFEPLSLPQGTAMMLLNVLIAISDEVTVLSVTIPQFAFCICPLPVLLLVVLQL